MTASAGFLREARGRLLPASIPFRFFGAAVACHVAAWLALLAAAPALARFTGGLGAPLLALHLVTLGVLVMTAFGAGLQLLPVATRQPVASAGAAAALWWVYAGGATATLAAMGLRRPALLAAAGAVTMLALLAYALLLARSLHRARGMPVVAVHGWASVASLVVALAGALALVSAWQGAALLARPAAVGLHIAFAAYGFMGLLMLGFSHVLVPMFALADAPPRVPSLVSAGAVIAALALWAGAAFGAAPTLLAPLGLGLGLLGLALHVALMERAIRGGLRPRLGRPFVLVRTGWAALAGSLAVALAIALDAALPRLPALFGVLLALGLLSVLLGMLSRIVPFLATMHAPSGRRGPPLPSSLTSARALDLHAGCHLVAGALLLAGVASDSAALVALAATVGTVGAVAFAWFFGVAWRGVRRAPAAADLSQIK